MKRVFSVLDVDDWMEAVREWASTSDAHEKRLQKRLHLQGAL